MEFFGSRDKIAQGKMQMQDGMPDGSLLLVPSDPIVDPFLPSNLEVVRFGDGAELTVSELTEFKDHLTFSTNFLDGQVTLPVTGKYNATNAMVAAYVAKHLGVTEENILSALANLQLTKNRTEWKKSSQWCRYPFRRLQCQSNSHEAHFGDLLSHS